MSVKLYQILSYDLVKKYELEVPGIENETLKIHEVATLFKNSKRNYNIRGKAFILVVNNQIFFLTKKRDDFNIYELV